MLRRKMPVLIALDRHPHAPFWPETINALLCQKREISLNRHGSSACRYTALTPDMWLESMPATHQVLFRDQNCFQASKRPPAFFQFLQQVALASNPPCAAFV